VWLTSPRAGKLDPKWEKYKLQKDQQHRPATYTISDRKQTKAVNVNRLRPHIQPALKAPTEPRSEKVSHWSPPSVEHIIMDTEESPAGSRYPTRNCRPPDWFRLP